MSEKISSRNVMNKVEHIRKTSDVLGNDVYEFVMNNERFPAMKVKFYVTQGVLQELSKRIVNDFNCGP